MLNELFVMRNVKSIGVVPPVPPQKKQVEPLEATYYKAVPPVPPVPPQKTISESVSKKSGKVSNLVVICYTPKGSVIEIVAVNEEHAAWLAKMNPRPKEDATN